MMKTMKMERDKPWMAFFCQQIKYLHILSTFLKHDVSVPILGN